MSKYYGVIGNRDFIKYHGEKRPFWEFLDVQPDGYLTSLVYMRKDLPNMPMIFDCGAWSYRNEETPKITPESALEQYMVLAKPGDIVIAPDHMLIKDVDLKKRRLFNTKSAKRFLEICPEEFHPMATVHGMDLKERLAHAKTLVKMGYKHIAVGGIAARASQKALVLSIVLELRKAIPNVWLHVLGLSSPDYAAAWNEYGVESFDGSSHFKQAFTAGTFFMLESGKLKKYQASRPTKGELPTAPHCECKACSKLRSEGIDTRTYGSNENNMGRAAHNMNMLMQAHQIAIHGETIFISCVGKKLPSSAPAKELYQSDWFKKARVWAEGTGKDWYILSAKHGVLSPDDVIAPYEKTLNTMSSKDRRLWAKSTTTQINNIAPKGKITFLAGKKYREFLGIEGGRISVPMEGLGIGQQLAWLNKQNTKQKEMF